MPPLPRARDSFGTRKWRETAQHSTHTDNLTWATGLWLTFRSFVNGHKRRAYGRAGPGITRCRLRVGHVASVSGHCVPSNVQKAPSGWRVYYWCSGVGPCPACQPTAPTTVGLVPEAPEFSAA